ncbi:MAG: sugar phosphate isomerase/epimerase [Lachnospiraceae bacterium]|nr:sugar phosphate isomerase/epimerase [Lachnospiraceae bacterium]
MQFCMNEASIMAKGNLLQHIADCGDRGIRRIELRKVCLMDHLRSGGTLREIREALESRDMCVPCINSIESISFHDKRSMRLLKETAEYLFYCSREIGCDCIEVIASFKVPETDISRINAATSEALTALSDLAEPYGIRLALEYMGVPASSVQTFDQALSIIRQTGRENVGILLDTWHHFAMRSPVEDILKAKKDEIFIVHTSDCPDKEAGTLIRQESYLPGDGACPIVPMLKNLKKIGYDGIFSVEVFDPALLDQPADKFIPEAVEKTLAVMREADVLTDPC